jgi:Bacterial Ig-like domain (group 2).
MKKLRKIKILLSLALVLTLVAPMVLTNVASAQRHVQAQKTEKGKNHSNKRQNNQDITTKEKENGTDSESVDSKDNKNTDTQNKIKKDKKEFQLNKKKVVLKVGESYQLSVKVATGSAITVSGSAITVSGSAITVNDTTTASGSAITWSSKNTNKATVTQDGLVTGVKAGATVITAQIGDKKATCIVIIKKENNNKKKHSEKKSGDKFSGNAKKHQTYNKKNK